MDLTIMLAQSLLVTEPPMYCCGIRIIFLTEPGGEISFLRCDKDVVTGNDGWQEKKQNPWKIECGRNPCHNSNATQVQGISGNREHPRGNHLTSGKPRVGWLTIP